MWLRRQVIFPIMYVFNNYEDSETGKEYALTVHGPLPRTHDIKSHQWLKLLPK